MRRIWLAVAAVFAVGATAAVVVADAPEPGDWSVAKGDGTPLVRQRGTVDAQGCVHLRNNHDVTYRIVCPPSPGTTTTTVAATTTSTTSTTVEPTTTTTVAPTTSTTTSTTIDPNELIDAYQPDTNCPDHDVVPLGQTSRAFNFEPLGPIWCFDLNDPPAPTRVEGPNTWVDDFEVGCTIPAPVGCTSMMRLDDGDMGYRVYDRAGANPPDRSQHWINQNHWMVDAVGGFTGGSSMRPDRSFRFEDGVITMTAVVAAAIPEYGDETWTELTFSSAPEPTGVYADQLYAYGQFGGHWSVGCRLQADRTPTCAVMGPNANTPTGSACFAIPGGYRVIEISWFQQCGSTHVGGLPGGVRGDIWTACEPDGPDMPCRVKLRMEVRQNGLKLFASNLDGQNEILYFEDSGWPSTNQLPASFVNGDVYAYQSNWQVRAGDRAYRYHWDHFAVNAT